MTTGNNRLEDRIARENGQSLEYTIGIPIDGSVDPTGEYPRRNNWFGLSVSRASRGITINELWSGGSVYGIDYRLPMPLPSLFPFNQANETPSGHSIEVDDTPGNERILFKHKTGAGIEVKPDGSVLIVSRGNNVQFVNGEHNIVVQGQGNINYDGDYNVTVNGNYNLTVNGNYNLEIGANENHAVNGTLRTEVGDVMSEVVRGNRDYKTYGDTVNFSVGNVKNISKQDIRNVVGRDYIINSKRHVRMTAEENVTAAAEKRVVLGGEGMFIFGREGKIGSDNMQFMGKLYTGPADGNGSETVFQGNLVGRALEAWTSKYAIYSEEAHSAHISNFATQAKQSDEATKADYADTAGAAPDGEGVVRSSNDYGNWTGGPSGDGAKEMSTSTQPDYQFDWGWNAPGRTTFDAQSDFVVNGEVGNYYVTNYEWMETWLKASPYGVRKVYVDEDDALADKIAKIDSYSEYFRWTPTTEEIRSKLRTMDGANDAATSPEMQTDGAKCINSLLNENRLHPLYLAGGPVAPYEVKQFANQLPAPKFGYTLLGNPLERASKTFQPKLKSSERTVLVDPVYNPDKLETPIVSSTKLSRRTTISTFLGAPGSRSSLEFIPNRNERHQLARQLYLHAALLDGIAGAQEFKGYRLQVTEAYYNPANGIRRKYQTGEPAINRYWREPYRLEDGGNTQKSVISSGKTINELKKEGRCVLYTLYNSRGRVDYSAGFDLALYIRDNFYYDQLSLDYDHTRPDGTLNQQIMVIMPEVPGNWKMSFELDVATYFNRQLFSGADLVEISD